MNKTTSANDNKRETSRFNLPFAKDEMVSYYLLLGFAVLTLAFIAIVGSQSSVDDPSLPQIPSFLPYWGEVTATIDWCEPNYTVSPYIAEFVNTITNIGFVVLGLFGIYMHPNLELRFYLAYVSIIFVGFGSAAFHATLKWYAQLGDEVCSLSSSAFLSFFFDIFIWFYFLFDYLIILFYFIYFILFYFIDFESRYQCFL